MLKLIIGFILSTSVVFAGEVEFTVHHAVGGPSDRITRLLASKMSTQKFKVVNRPGAQGRIAVKQLLSSNSMMVATVPQILVTNFLLPTDPGYKEDDLELIYIVGAMPNVLVCNNNLGFKTYKDFLSTRKSLNFGVAGYGSSEHLATEFLFRAINSQQHMIIPYAQGGAASLNDLLSGNIDCMFANYPLVKSHVVEGKRITAIISSHNLGLTIPNWQQEFKEPFPFQGTLGIVISKKLNQSVKDDLISDLEKITNDVLREEIKESGVFPILKNDGKTIQDTIRQNERLKNLIVRYNIRTYE